jgi:hypothetical protein
MTEQSGASKKKNYKEMNWITFRKKILGKQ